MVFERAGYNRRMGKNTVTITKTKCLSLGKELIHQNNMRSGQRITLLFDPENSVMAINTEPDADETTWLLFPQNNKTPGKNYFISFTGIINKYGITYPQHNIPTKIQKINSKDMITFQVKMEKRKNDDEDN